MRKSPSPLSLLVASIVILSAGGLFESAFAFDLDGDDAHTNAVDDVLLGHDVIVNDDPLEIDFVLDLLDNDLSDDILLIKDVTLDYYTLDGTNYRVLDDVTCSPKPTANLLNSATLVQIHVDSNTPCNSPLTSAVMFFGTYTVEGQTSLQTDTAFFVVATQDYYDNFTQTGVAVPDVFYETFSPITNSWTTTIDVLDNDTSTNDLYLVDIRIDDYSFTDIVEPNISAVIINENGVDKIQLTLNNIDLRSETGIMSITGTYSFTDGLGSYSTTTWEIIGFLEDNLTVDDYSFDLDIFNNVAPSLGFIGVNLLSNAVQVQTGAATLDSCTTTSFDPASLSDVTHLIFDNTLAVTIPGLQSYFDLSTNLELILECTISDAYGNSAISTVTFFDIFVSVGDGQQIANDDFIVDSFNTSNNIALEIDVLDNDSNLGTSTIINTELTSVSVNGFYYDATECADKAFAEVGIVNGTEHVLIDYSISFCSPVANKMMFEGYYTIENEAGYLDTAIFRIAQPSFNDPGNSIDLVVVDDNVGLDVTAFVLNGNQKSLDVLANDTSLEGLTIMDYTLDLYSTNFVDYYTLTNGPNIPTISVETIDSVDHLLIGYSPVVGYPITADMVFSGTYTVSDGLGHFEVGNYELSTDILIPISDSDGDGILDPEDICEGGDDNIDTDGDGIPDFCDPTPNDDPVTSYYPTAVNDVFTVSSYDPNDTNIIDYDLDVLFNDISENTLKIDNVSLDHYTYDGINYFNFDTTTCQDAPTVSKITNNTEIRLSWVPAVSCNITTDGVMFAGIYTIEDQTTSLTDTATFVIATQVYYDNFTGDTLTANPDTAVRTFNPTNSEWGAIMSVLKNDNSTHDLNLVDIHVENFTFDGVEFFTLDNYEYPNAPTVKIRDVQVFDTIRVDLDLLPPQLYTNILMISGTYTVTDGHGSFDSTTWQFSTLEYEEFIINGNNEPSTSTETSVKKKKRGGGGCDDCTPPTFGKNKAGALIVSDGFVYNGNSTDVDLYHTEFPLITAKTNVTNTMTVKVYENQGVNNMKMVQFGLGMTEVGASLSEAETLIEVHYSYGAFVDWNLIDEHNLIDVLYVISNTVSCMDNSPTECLQVTVSYVYRDQTKNNVVAINAIDMKRNSSTNYLNDGILVTGESLNESAISDVASGDAGYYYPQKRGLVTLTQVDYKTDTWVDEFGYEWGVDDNGFYLIDTLTANIVINSLSPWTGSSDRTHSFFETSKILEAVRAGYTIHELEILRTGYIPRDLVNLEHTYLLD